MKEGGQVGARIMGDLLLRNAEQHGEAPALSWKEEGTWRTASWREYRERVMEIAAGLASLGIEHGERVAIMAANRPEHVIAALGAVHACSTPTSLYATLPPEQIRYIANDCSARMAILENRELMERWLEAREELPHLEHIVLMEDAESYAHVRGVISWADLVARGRVHLREHVESWRAAKPEDPVTIIYTSGTTGPPKGVLLTHSNCLFEVSSLARVAGVPRRLTYVSYLPLAHIVEQIAAIYGPLLMLFHVHFCPDPKLAVEYVRDVRPSLFVGVPRVWEKIRSAITVKLEAAQGPRRMLARAALAVGRETTGRKQRGEPLSFWLRARQAIMDRLVLSKVRTKLGLDRCVFALSGAAPLDVEVSELFHALGLPIAELYGMTETAGCATGSGRDDIRIGAVGRALPGVELSLAEDGEVLVRGPICTPGYFNRPKETSELVDSDGWLHTGDIGRLDGDGYLYIVDRKKELIITAGGKNVSPSNIEAYLKEHPLVGQALAFGDRKPFVVTLIALDGEVAASWARQRGIAFGTLADLAGRPEVLAEIGLAVERTNARLARVEQVKRFRVLPDEWTPERGELTPTMKLKRRVIHERYAKEIAELYA